MATTVGDILSFHAADGKVFQDIVQLGRGRETAKNVAALWMWLDLIGFNNVILHIRDRTDGATLVRAVREAEAILDCLHQDAPPPADNINAIPLTSQLSAEPVNLRFFYCHRDVVVQGITDILDGVGKLIFDDNLRGAANNAPPNPNAAAALAMPYQRGPEIAPVIWRTMLVTFTRGYTLDSDELVQYFTGRWGNCIENVFIERTNPGVAPMYGRIVFTSPSILGLVLQSERPIEFVINGKQIWASSFIRRNI